jgi:hypothetical protein
VSWTYDVTKFSDPTVGDLMQIRFLIQDTTAARPLLQDEEIQLADSQHANVFMAAAACCDQLIARAGNISSRKVGDLSLTYDPKFYRELRGGLRARGLAHQVPSAGGLSVADKLAQAADSDAVRPAFVRGMEENPGAPQPAGISPNPLGRPPSP